MKERLAILITALWWGSLTTLGFMVVPMLFAHLPTPALAGNTAARLFSAQTWMSTGCGMLLMMILGSNRALPSANGSLNAIGLIAFSMLLSFMVEFGVAPRIVARENLKLWHSAGSLMYFLQWLSTGLLLWRLTRRPHP